MKAPQPPSAVGPDGLVMSEGEDRKLNDAVKTAFETPAGRRVLQWLESITINRVAGPGVNTEQLMHMEGGRYVVAAIRARIQQAKERKPYASVDTQRPPARQRQVRPE